MGHLEVVAQVGGLTPAAIYAVLCDFARYPERSQVVRSVICMPSEGGQNASAWEVNFGEGILRWTEEDVFDADAHTIAFRQIEGDIEQFTGTWSVSQEGELCLIRFECDFDIGLPGLNAILEPIAVRALRDIARSILKGLVPSLEFTSDGVNGNAGEGSL